MFPELTPLQIKAFCIFVGPLYGIFVMFIAYKIFDSITPFNTAKELDDANEAVGTLLGHIMMGVGICVGLITGFAIF